MAKSKKPTEIVPIMVRIRESLRKRLARAAEANAQSLNAEIGARLEYTFDEEDRWDQQNKEMEKRRGEFDEMSRQYYEERAQREAEYKAALRDTRLLTMMLGSSDNADLLRAFIFYINEHPDWTASPEKRRDLADAIYSFLLDDVVVRRQKK